jgi:hypothetical protein
VERRRETLLVPVVAGSFARTAIRLSFPVEAVRGGYFWIVRGGHRVDFRVEVHCVSALRHSGPDSEAALLRAQYAAWQPLDRPLSAVFCVSFRVFVLLCQGSFVRGSVAVVVLRGFGVAFLDRGISLGPVTVVSLGIRSGDDTSPWGVGFATASSAARLWRGVTRGIPLVRRFTGAVVVAVVVAVAVPALDLRRGIFDGERGGAAGLPVEGSGAVTGAMDDRRRFGGIVEALGT